MTAVIAVAGLVSLTNSVRALVPGANQRVSMSSTGSQANNGSGGGTYLSPNGKVVVFDSIATNILPSGGKGIFSKNLATGAVTRVNVSTSGVVANADTSVHRISTTGRYVLFKSGATNLIDGTTTPASPSNPQLYLRDTTTSATTLISKSSGGVISNGGSTEGVGVSSDGRFIAFTANATNLHPDATSGSHLYMIDQLTGSLSVIDRKTDGTVGSTAVGIEGAMSCDGSMIAFSYGSNLILSDTYSGHKDIYLLDRRGGSDKLTNLTRTANQAAGGPSISCNGDFVGFKSVATNIDPAISVTYAYNAYRPYVFDRVNGTYYFAAVTTSGVASTAAVCGTFSDGICIQPSDMGVAVFAGNDSALTGASGNQVYLRDIYSGTTELVSRNNSAIAGNGFSFGPTISADGTQAVYPSSSSNLVTGDTNSSSDVFSSLTGY